MAVCVAFYTHHSVTTQTAATFICFWVLRAQRRCTFGVYLVVEGKITWEEGFWPMGKQRWGWKLNEVFLFEAFLRFFGRADLGVEQKCESH